MINLDIGAFQSVSNPLTVTHTGDTGIGSLRYAMEWANNQTGLDTITFDIPTSDPNYNAGLNYWSILVTSALPTISDPVIINGKTQPGYVAQPVIEVRGENAGSGVHGFTITVGSSILEGLVINRFGGTGVYISGTAATGNIVRGNYIGTDVTGNQDLGNSSFGVSVGAGADGNFIGTNGDGSGDQFEGNVISGNDAHGVWIAGDGTDGNVVAGNLIGLNAVGNAAIGNNGSPVSVADGAKDTRIGTNGDGLSDADERNVMSGNWWEVLVYGETTNRTVIAGNYIGTNITGDAAMGNGTGIQIRYGAKNTEIGTDGSNDAFNTNECNVISGNNWAGIVIQTPEWTGLMPSDGTTTDGTVIAGNYIGINAAEPVP